MNNKYLVLDSGVTKKITNLELVPGKAEKCDLNPLFKEEFFATPSRPWEVRYDNGYPNVFYDDNEGIYRCYYTTFIIDSQSAETPLHERPGKQYRPRPGRITSLCYAYSKDGLHWIKPNLGKVDFNGNKENNIMMYRAHGASVIYDRHESDPGKKYKMVTRVDGENRHMGVAFSANGIDWSEMIPWPEHNPVADSHNFAFWDEQQQKYVLITRQWHNGLRIVARCESDDFIHWSEPVEIFQGQGFHQQVYSMPVFKYGQVYLGLGAIFRDGDRTLDDWDKVDCELLYSNDTVHWDVASPGKSLIPRGEGDYPSGKYDSGCIYTSAPIFKGEQVWIYYMGGNGQHTNFRETSLNLAVFSKDRFAGYTVRNTKEEGVFQTSRFKVFANKIEVTADIGEGGIVEAAVCDQEGHPLAGFHYRDCTPLTSTATEAAIEWPAGDMAAISDQYVTISFRLKNATLYSFGGNLEHKRRIQGA